MAAAQQRGPPVAFVGIPAYEGRKTRVICGNSRSDSRVIAQLLVHLLHLAHLVFPHDSSVAGPLATVDVLERRMSASRSVGGLLAEHIAECVLATSFVSVRVPLVDADAEEAVRSAVARPAAPTREMRYALFPHRDGIHFQITSEQKSEKVARCRVATNQKALGAVWEGRQRGRQ